MGPDLFGSAAHGGRNSIAAWAGSEEEPMRGRRHHMSCPLWVRYQTRSGQEGDEIGELGLRHEPSGMLGNAGRPRQSFQGRGKKGPATATGSSPAISSTK